jgi:hypothetical protein
MFVMPARAARGAGAAHQHRGGEGFAAGARAVVRDHLAPARCEQPGEKLAALVLHLDQALDEERMAVDGRLAGETQSRWRVRGF